jgi:hypothetical protein
MESAVITPHRRIAARASGRALMAGLVVLGTALPVSPAAAQGIFDFFFGGPRRSQPSSVSSYADPNASNPFGSREQAPRVESGGAAAFCVRTCDGRYFPIQRASGANPAQVCSSFCPAARTKVFSGGAIEHAAASDGSRYKDLPAAFAYREKTVADCSCNGKDPYGLVTTDAHNDPTLRQGDIVATEQGFVAYSGSRGQRNAEFTPVESYSGLASDVRQRLAGAKIMPRNATPVPDQTGSIAADGKSVQLDR